ncbi:hypothetical protein GCM10023231_18290 [Olivibacter ginsenosidimutans]|uniref:Photosynthetic reaction center cytochrome c subunit n=1 Tax=Olivibacter ginsenosidimutans TaxID=1176537 RepID=A0ABP9B4W5_9SPHI
MHYKKLITLSTALSFIALLSAFMPQQEHKAKNLKVLPKDISHEELDKVMDGFKVALGVKCNFCHAAKKDDPTKLDFASDENHHKEVARNMMRMTAKINKKYFNRAGKDGAVKAISCVTCHNGEKHPKMM